MLNALSQVDTFLLRVVNGAHHPLLDALMLFVTDIKRTGILLLLVWIGLMWKGGARGRTVALLLIPLILLTDQLSSHVLKELFGRARPCEMLQGVRAIDGCRHSASFPSSHAVNTFAAATLFAFFYRRWVPWVAFGLAAVVSYSRVYLGLHYPSDVLGGAVIGAFCALAMVWGYRALATPMQRDKDAR
ncbi:Putative undecaprenyl-diphosphatase YbjG [bacterium HR16]|nr:Putative undecaprenyl-diphosphatase YbjG [bacterium HR16]